MYVWRVEHKKEKFGPFSAGTIECYVSEHTPTPGYEPCFPVIEVVEAARVDSTFVFGVQRRFMLKYWFRHEDDIEKLASHNFVLRVYRKIDKSPYNYVPLGKQCMFKRSAFAVVREYDVRSILDDNPY